MEAIFLKLIDQLNSSVVVLLLLLALAFYASYKVTNFMTSCNIKHDHSDKRLETVEEIRDTVIATRERVQIIYEMLMGGKGIAPSDLDKAEYKLRIISEDD